MKLNEIFQCTHRLLNLIPRCQRNFEWSPWLLKALSGLSSLCLQVEKTDWLSLKNGDRPTAWFTLNFLFTYNGRTVLEAIALALSHKAFKQAVFFIYLCVEIPHCFHNFTQTVVQKRQSQTQRYRKVCALLHTSIIKRLSVRLLCCLFVSALIHSLWD